MDSRQITETINNSPDPVATKLEIWSKTRYLVGQKAPSPSNTTTRDGWFEGKIVVPGPMGKYGAIPKNSDLQLMEDLYFIRFTDNATTQGADESIVRALHTVMTNAQADEYEKVLKKELNITDDNDDLYVNEGRIDDSDDLYVNEGDKIEL